MAGYSPADHTGDVQRAVRHAYLHRVLVDPDGGKRSTLEVEECLVGGRTARGPRCPRNAGDPLRFPVEVPHPETVRDGGEDGQFIVSHRELAPGAVWVSVDQLALLPH